MQQVTIFWNFVFVPKALDRMPSRLITPDPVEKSGALQTET